MSPLATGEPLFFFILNHVEAQSSDETKLKKEESSRNFLQRSDGRLLNPNQQRDYY